MALRVFVFMRKWDYTMKAHQRAEFVYGDNFFTCFTLFFSFKRVYRAGVPPVIWHGQALAMLIIDKKIYNSHVE